MLYVVIPLTVATLVAVGWRGARPPGAGYREGVRICLVTPYAWDRPHEANDHWSVLAGGLAGAGHDVVVLAPGRSAAVLQGVGRALEAVCQAHFASQLASRPIGVTLQIEITAPAARSVPGQVDPVTCSRIADSPAS